MNILKTWNLKYKHDRQVINKAAIENARNFFTHPNQLPLCRSFFVCKNDPKLRKRSAIQNRKKIIYQELGYRRYQWSTNSVPKWKEMIYLLIRELSCISWILWRWPYFNISLHFNSFRLVQKLVDKSIFQNANRQNFQFLTLLILYFKNLITK